VAAHRLGRVGVPSPTQSEEWIQLERQLDAIAPNGGKLALRIKQNIEAKRGKIKTIKEMRDQDRSLGLKEAMVMYEAVEAHMRSAALGGSVERPPQPKAHGFAERRSSREETDSTPKERRDRPADYRSLLWVAAFLVPVIVVVLLVASMREEPTLQGDRAGVEPIADRRLQDSAKAVDMLANLGSLSTHDVLFLDRLISQRRLSLGTPEFVERTLEARLDTASTLVRRGSAVDVRIAYRFLRDLQRAELDTEVATRVATLADSVRRVLQETEARPSRRTTAAAPQRQASPTTRPLPYRVVEQKDYSFATTKRMAYRIVLTTNTLPDRATLRTTAEEIWKKGNRGWNEFTVFMYLPAMNTNDMAYGVAEFSSSGLQDFRVQPLALAGTRWQR
jgi:hypothetical protein